MTLTLSVSQIPVKRPGNLRSAGSRELGEPCLDEKEARSPRLDGKQVLLLSHPVAPSWSFPSVCEACCQCPRDNKGHQVGWMVVSTRQDPESLGRQTLWEFLNWINSGGKAHPSHRPGFLRKGVEHQRSSHPDRAVGPGILCSWHHSRLVPQAKS